MAKYSKGAGHKSVLPPKLGDSYFRVDLIRTIGVTDGNPFLFQCGDTGRYPGNDLPVILYKGVLNLPLWLKSWYIKRLFRRNGWTNVWSGGVFTYAHYHSTAHEVLGFYKGHSIIQLGGETGHNVPISSGDVLIIPAGVAHKNLGDEDQIMCVGAYADGREFDINTGEPGERPKTDRQIAGLAVPTEDPVYGRPDGLTSIWGS
jgi:uncharacterized protein YjlB